MHPRRARLLDQLANPVVIVEDVPLLNDRARDVAQAFRPRNAWQDWLTAQVAVLMTRIDRSTRIERRLRDHASLRAIDCWDEDRILEAEEIGATLPRDPARVVARLRRTPAGCDWLARRWRALEAVDPRDWTDGQRLLADRLAGAAVDPATPGFAAARVAELADRRAAAAGGDALRRAEVAADLSDDVPGLARLRRHAGCMRRQMKWYVDQFHVEHADRWDDPMRQPADVSRALLTEERSRKPYWGFAPRESAPVRDETNPSAVASPPRSDETKPSPRVEGMARLADAVAELVAGEPDAADPGVPAAAGRGDRPRRGDPAAEACRRARAVRRRAALAGAAGP